MPGQSLFVANWKMNMPLAQAIKFCTENLQELEKLGAHENTEVVICPSFPALYPLDDFLKQTEIYIGAQNCSEHQKGAYTGEVDAQSLAEAGCLYCIVGHSERRHYFGETNKIVAQKATRLLEHDIEPIICIGETKEEYEKKQTYDVLSTQLEPVMEIIKALKIKPAFCIAYEPVWSIGTGIVPEKSYLEEVFGWIRQQLDSYDQEQSRLVYGGSVTEENAAEIKKIPYIDGFLIGGASLDFQKLKKIVLLGI